MYLNKQSWVSSKIISFFNGSIVSSLLQILFTITPDQATSFHVFMYFFGMGSFKAAGKKPKENKNKSSNLKCASMSQHLVLLIRNGLKLLHWAIHSYNGCKSINNTLLSRYIMRLDPGIQTNIRSFHTNKLNFIF